MEVADIVEIEDFRPQEVEMENVTREQVKHFSLDLKNYKS